MNESITLIIVGIFAFLVTFLILGSFWDKNLRSKGVPSSTIKKGYQKTFISYIVLVGILFLLWLLMFLGFRQSIQNSLVIAGGIILVPTYIWMIIAWLQARKKAGKILLDLTVISLETLYLISGILLIASGLFGGYSFIWKNSQYSWLISSLIGLYMGAGMIFVGFVGTKVQVHERGIMAFGSLLKWEKIESFEWISSNEKTYTAKLKLRNRPPKSTRDGILIVPIEKKLALETILEQYLVPLNSSTPNHT